MRAAAARELELRSAALVVQTRVVLEAFRDDSSDEKIDSLIEGQREAFTDFSRECDPSLALEPSTRENIDLVMQLEKEIAVAIERQRVALVEQDRALSSRVDLARAFQSRTPEPPRFITRRV